MNTFPAYIVIVFNLVDGQIREYPISFPAPKSWPKWYTVVEEYAYDLAAFLRKYSDAGDGIMVKRFASANEAEAYLISKGIEH